MSNSIHSAIIIAIVIALQIRGSIQEAVSESDKLLESNLVDGCDAEVFDPSKTYANHLPRFCGVTENYLTWHAALQYKGLAKDSPLLNCSGTLISKRYVLTAAHCASSDMPPYKVRLGMPTIRENRNWRYIGIECWNRKESSWMRTSFAWKKGLLQVIHAERLRAQS
ncbi:spaetzle-processing enzyme-like [Toxorhynchites rutilus septentrionalis]|uniref:spaetzle-processing enzyme-like n=1 Tax=Toxorhynchites rutilus septentrionalis TaxID=329112 RepID=UPI00247A64C2|nr:spaetzle-processing enzyme-like [Toxorhynchites rutilus septentrionalis]